MSNQTISTSAFPNNWTGSISSTTQYWYNLDSGTNGIPWTVPDKSLISRFIEWIKLCPLFDHKI
jgi:hypothetical protein